MHRRDGDDHHKISFARDLVTLLYFRSSQEARSHSFDRVDPLALNDNLDQNRDGTAKPSRVYHRNIPYDDAVFAHPLDPPLAADRFTAWPMVPQRGCVFTLKNLENSNVERIETFRRRFGGSWCIETTPSRNEAGRLQNCSSRMRASGLASAASRRWVVPLPS